MSSIKLYNQTARRLVNKEITYTTLKVLLLKGATYSATATNISHSSIAPYEVSGNGWPVGGVALTNAIIEEISGDDARLVADNVSVPAAGGDIGPADAYVVYDDTDDYPLLMVQIGADIIAADGTPFQIVWGTNGIIVFDYAAA